MKIVEDSKNFACLDVQDFTSKIQAFIDFLTTEDGKAIVDWKSNKEIEKQIWNEVDDYFYNLSLEIDKQIPFEILDEFVEEIIKIAKKLML